MESISGPCQSKNDGNILLNLHKQSKITKDTATKLRIQSQIDDQIAKNYLFYMVGNYTPAK